jgi:flavin reductase (DIM6/NTAB) family NADH-FMN oxidoreductase RutF
MSAMHKLSYGLFVVTAKGDKGHNGCITNTVMQVTVDPEMIVVAVNKANYTHDLIVASGEFNVSVISEDANFELFKHFGFQSGRDVDKFGFYEPWGLTANRLAYVKEGTNAYISARVESSMDLGTHTLFVARVTESKVLSDVPSATYAYYFANIKPKPAEKAANAKTKWRCKICGFEIETEELAPDFICPWCKHGVEDFEKV